MTNKERLEEIIELMCESYHSYLVADNIKRSEVSHKRYLDYKETIKSEFEKQAERAQELEDIIYQDEQQAMLEGLYEENKRYREALEFYANKNKYMYKSTSLKGHPTIISDVGEVARKALESGNGDN